MAMQEKGLVARVDGGGRVAKFRHRLDEQLVLPKNARRCSPNCCCAAPRRRAR
jgi:hypothetical protein